MENSGEEDIEIARKPSETSLNSKLEVEDGKKGTQKRWYRRLFKKDPENDRENLNSADKKGPEEGVEEDIDEERENDDDLGSDCEYSLSGDEEASDDITLDNILDSKWVKDIDSKANSEDQHDLLNVIKDDTPLMRAIRLRRSEVAFDSLERISKEDLKVKDLLGNSALFLAILHLPELELLSTLIRKGITLDQTELDYKGRTPLMIACKKGLTDVAKFLLTAKRDKEYILSLETIDKIDNSGTENALMLAIDNKLNTITKLLIKRGARFDLKLQGQPTVLIRALEAKMPDVAEVMLQKGLDLAAGNTWLRGNAANKSPSINLVQFVNEKNSLRRSETALGLAFKQNYSECIKLLLSCGANIYNDKGKITPITALDYKNLLDYQIKIDSKNRTKIVFDYSKVTSDEKGKELKMLADLTEISKDHKKLITHPLIETILMMKWKMVEPVWLGYMILKLLFMVIFMTIGGGGFGGLHQNDCNAADRMNMTLDCTLAIGCIGSSGVEILRQETILNDRYKCRF